LLRAAVAAGAFAEAERLLDVFRAEMQDRWAAATSVEDRVAIAAGVSEILEWARTATLAARAHAQRKLIHLLRMRAYTAYSQPVLPEPSEIRR
jgi:hypothetical protein